jgi:glycosyltransferase involved in cell wall biosynthesis
VTLVPLYTPIRTDEQDISSRRVFFGGINVYLQERFSLFRKLPRWMDRWLDWPWLIRAATSFGIQTEAKLLGALAVSVLQGAHGHQRKEVDRLASWLADELRPELVNFTNFLVGGCIPEIKRRTGAAVVVTLQGDDIFLNDLVQPYKSQALAEIGKLDADVDAYLVNSHYYADHMADFLSLPRAKFHIVPLGIDTTDFLSFTRDAAEVAARAPTVGYLARLAPEKGLHLLVEAFLLLKQMTGMSDARLHIAGWLGAQHKKYVEEQFHTLRAARHAEHFHYFGEVDRAGKLEFLRGIDVLSVPTIYHEPKGLFVLESLAAGAPVVQPRHGALPELLASTGGGLLFEPGNAPQLAETLHALLLDADQRRQLGEAGRAAVLEKHSHLAMAEQTSALFQPFVAGRK